MSVLPAIAAATIVPRIAFHRRWRASAVIGFSDVRPVAVIGQGKHDAGAKCLAGEQSTEKVGAASIQKALHHRSP